MSWRAGREAASHKVYLSDDQQAVAGGTASAVTVSAPEYETSLLLNKIYYWKVTEVNDAEAIRSWDSSVWSFTTNEFVAVDDFEAYDDKENRIYDVLARRLGRPRQRLDRRLQPGPLRRADDHPRRQAVDAPGL